MIDYSSPVAGDGIFAVHASSGKRKIQKPTWLRIFDCVNNVLPATGVANLVFTRIKVAVERSMQSVYG